MGIRDIFRRSKKHNSTETRDLNALQSLFGGSIGSGYVSPDQAIRLTAVYRAVSLVSSKVASLPLILYRERPDGRGRDRATDHPLFTTLHDSPNPYQTSFRFRAQIVSSLLLRGEAFIFKIHDQAGRILFLVPLNPDSIEEVRIDRQTLKPEYILTKSDGARERLGSDEIIHLMGAVSLDGIRGASPIRLFADPLGLALDQEAHSRSFFKNGATPLGVLETQESLTDETYDRLSKDFTDRYSGPSQSHKPFILEAGLTYRPITVSPRDSQLLEARKYSVEDVARIFGVPVHMLASGEKSSYSSMEQQEMEFLTCCISPWLESITQSLNVGLFTPQERRTLKCEFLDCESSQ